MGILASINAYLKSQGGQPMPLPGGDIAPTSGRYWYSQPWTWLPSAGAIDYEKEAGDADLNAIVRATIRWLGRTVGEAPLQVLIRAGTPDEEPVVPHPLTDLMRRPNPYYLGKHLLRGVIADLVLDGNGYVIMFPNAAGTNAAFELWWEPHDSIRPISDENTFLSGYELKRGGLWQWRLPPEAVIHFRDELDPADTRRGLSPLKSLLREIFTDNEAASFSASILKNMGMPGIVASPKTADGFIDDPEALKARIMEKTGGSHRGEPLVVTGPMDISMLSWSPEQLNLTQLRRIPEERISAVLGVPPIVLNLGAGLDASTYANYETAKRAVYEHTVGPMQDMMAEQLQLSLLPLLGNPDAESVAFDRSEVTALQEDVNARYTRVISGWKEGTLKRSEARVLLKEDLDIGPEDEVYITDIKQKAADTIAAGQAAMAEARQQEPQEPPQDEATPPETPPETPPQTEGKGRKALPRAVDAGQAEIDAALSDWQAEMDGFFADAWGHSHGQD